VTSTPARADGSVLEQLALLAPGQLVLQRQRSDCWTAGPVIVTLRHLGVQNAKRDGEHEGSDEEYASGHHGSAANRSGCRCEWLSSWGVAIARPFNL
jgi:hypothetical protein